MANSVVLVVHNIRHVPLHRARRERRVTEAGISYLRLQLRCNTRFSHVDMGHMDDGISTWYRMLAPKFIKQCGLLGTY